MKYKELSKLYHMDSSSHRDTANKEEADKRFSSDSTFKIGYAAAEGELFIAVPRELSMLNEKILRTERRVSSRIKAMPGIASSSMLRGLVLDEIVSSNMIEGIHSTRRQIKDALNAMDSESNVSKRFKELATLYMAIIDETALLPTSPEEVRAIYDKVMDAELPKRDLPDGELFRASGVDVVDGTKVIHSGLMPEEKIVEAVIAMLDVASREEMPSLYSAIASHYLFEYAHPFYDGNGRTGRYLLALYLSVPLSMATSLSLSRTIAEHKNDYYKAFETVQNPLNHGELTHFVHQMLVFINMAQEQLLERLDASEEIFSNINNVMSDIAKDIELKEQEKKIVYMLMQHEAFGLFGDAPLPEISRYLGVGDQMTRRHLSSLEKYDIVEKVRGRDPMTFALTESFKNKFGITETEDDAENSRIKSSDKGETF